MNPVAEQKQKQQEADADAEAKADTYAVLLEDFMKKWHANSRPGTVYEARRILSRALPDIGSKPVREITDADIRKLRDRIAETRLKKWRGDTGPAPSG